MELLLLLLLSPEIFAHRHKTNNPNDEPFLPIYPVYPYSPKLIKRATERELMSQSTLELHPPKIDAKDSYSSSYSNNHQRDFSYSNYDPYPKTISSSSNRPTSYYEGDAYTNTPYNVYHSYPTPYTINPASYQAPAYPNYYYQPPYYYYHYFNPASFSLPSPAPPSSGIDYHDSSQQPETENDKQDQKKKKSKKLKEDKMTNQDSLTGQFMDGGNYISTNSRDLDGQSSTYKIASPINQLERDVQLRNLPISLPKTTYRVISVAGQPVGPNYPLPPEYLKAQQMEQLMSQTLSRLLTQKQVDQSYVNDKDTLYSANDEQYTNQNTYNPDILSYVTPPELRAKTDVTYVINPDNVSKKNQYHQASRLDPSSQTISDKNTKYAKIFYTNKAVSQATPNHSQGTYVSSDDRNKQSDRVIDSQPTDQTEEYDRYDPSQIYDIALNQSENKQGQNYENYQSQSDSYQNKDLITSSQAPRVYTYQYSAYEPDESTAQQQGKSNTNFGAKQYNKE